MEEINLLKEQTDKGCAKAAFCLSRYYGLCEGDRRKAEKWKRKSAELEYTPAMCEIAGDLLFSKDIRDQKEAIQLLKSAAKKNDGRAYGLLAYAFEEGIYVSQDYKRALKYYKKAIFNGDVWSFPSVVEYYEKGLHGRRSKVKAAVWEKLELEFFCSIHGKAMDRYRNRKSRELEKRIGEMSQHEKRSFQSSYERISEKIESRYEKITLNAQKKECP